MWSIRNELDFLIVKNALHGVKKAIVGQLIVLFVFIYFLFPYMGETPLWLWTLIQLFAYAFRYGINAFYQQLNNSKEHYVIATSLLRFYTVGLGITSILWGSAVLFLSAVPDSFHSLLYIIIIGFTFASVMSIGPVLSMYFAFTVPMNLAIFAHTLLHHDQPVYNFVSVIIVIGFVYSFLSSKHYYSVYHAMVRQKLNAIKALEEAQREKEYLQQHIHAIEEIGIGIVITDMHNTIVKINEPVREWFGDVEGWTFEEFLKQHIRKQEEHGSHKHVMTGDGKYFEMSIKQIDSSEELLILFKDVTEESRNRRIIQKMTERYKERSEIDPLTHILNRESFLQQLERMAYETDRKFGRFAILFIDIDNFKPINDTYGHKIGDLVLQVIAKRIQNTLRQSDLLGRYAGDEFIVALKDIEEREVARGVAKKLLQTLSQPVTIEDFDHPEAKKIEISVTVSIGISLYPDDTKDLLDLIDKADKAMYAVKSRTRNGYAFYTQRSQ